MVRPCRPRRVISAPCLTGKRGDVATGRRSMHARLRAHAQQLARLARVVRPVRTHQQSLQWSAANSSSRVHLQRLMSALTHCHHMRLQTPVAPPQRVHRVASQRADSRAAAALAVAVAEGCLKALVCRGMLPLTPNQQRLLPTQSWQRPLGSSQWRRVHRIIAGRPRARATAWRRQRCLRASCCQGVLARHGMYAVCHSMRWSSLRASGRRRAICLG